VGEFLIQKQKLNDPVGTEISRVNLAKGFKRGTGAEQADPFQVLGGLRSLVGRPPELAVIQAQQGGRGAGSLDVTSHADKMPALPVTHG
jgi:hypothetical protein